MSAGTKALKKGEYLFREGDPSDAVFVIKSGKIMITKTKGNAEISLAEVGPGQMLGEMSFFDNRPRSAGAKAMVDSETIILPFANLNAQFKTFPEWLKAMVKTINTNLREANSRIKNLEKVQKDEQEMFPPHTITKLCAILGLVANKYGEEVKEGLQVPSGVMRRYTIQVFQEPTHKMQRLMTVLAELDLMLVEELGEGKQRLVLKTPQLLMDFVDFYNDYLFKEESKRVTVEERECKILKALIYYGRNETPDEKGLVQIDLSQVQNDSMRDFKEVYKVEDFDSIAEKKITSEKFMDAKNHVTIKFNRKELESILPYWEIIYALKKAH